MRLRGPALVVLAALAFAGCIGATPLEDADLTPGDGLALDVEPNRTRIAVGEAVGFQVVVENRGAQEVTYRSGCRAAWDLDLRDGSGNEVQAHRPQAVCDAFRWAALEPGERTSYRESGGGPDLPWNGTLWNGSGYRDASPGTYTLHATFHHGSPDGPEGNVTATAKVVVEERRPPDDGPLEVDAEADRSTIAPGETVKVTLTATNTGNESLRYRSGCGHAWDVTVRNESGEEVQPHRPRPRCMGFSNEVLEPGETLPFPGHGGSGTFGWNGTLWNGSSYVDAPPDRYRIQGTVPYKMKGGGGGESDGKTRYASGTVAVRVTDS